jgi:hypothetical protein
MIKLPIATGWGDPMNSVPVVFAEYNSKTASGTLVDLSKRRTTYTKDVTVTLNPVLSASQAAGYTVEKVLSGSDNWKPNELVKQVNAPVVLLDGLNLTWNDDENALCWVVFKDGKYFKCVTTPYCAISTTDLNGKYTVRAANSMGGLGATSNIIDASATLVAERKPADSKSVLYCNPAEKTIYIQTAVSKMLKVNIFSLNGKTILSKKFNAFSEISGPIEIPFGELTSGIYLIRSEFDGSVKSEYLNLQY